LETKAHVDMLIALKNINIFPLQVREIFMAFHQAGFFEDSMLVGSWVMPLYQEAFGINYSLRTLDIDFAVEVIRADNDNKIDIDKLFTDHGYIPVNMQSGIRKYTRENFAVEFIVQRKGGRSGELVNIGKWNITAAPLPFVDILLAFPFIADFMDFRVRAPLPEAFFIHKLITSQRRPDESKKDKDLEQCSIIARNIDSARLRAVMESLKLSKKTTHALLKSCGIINFPPQNLGISR
jgi:hypothetical protein